MTSRTTVSAGIPDIYNEILLLFFVCVLGVAGAAAIVNFVIFRQPLYRDEAARREVSGSGHMIIYPFVPYLIASMFLGGVMAAAAAAIMTLIKVERKSLAYAATYDAAGNLAQVTESPAAATTTYSYDAAGRVLAESRAGNSPYTGTYTYDAAGRRSGAYRSENGVASHDATYAYDDAGRLVLVTDAVTTSGLGGSYVWNADGTLASFPGPGYVRNLGYDEEGRVTSIRRGSTLAFEYAYGFDGGRRWRKDLASNEWDWYPCGVACGSGELVEMRSDLSGSAWSVESTSLTGVRAGESFLLPGLASGIARALDAAGNITATPLLDAFGVMRSGALPEDPLRRLYGGNDDEEIRETFVLIGYPLPDPLDEGFTAKMCRGICASMADANGDGTIGPIERKRVYDPCVLACERVGAKGTRRLWCKGIEATIDHLLRHPSEGYKAIRNKQLLESLLALWNGMGCPGEPPSIER